MKKVLERCLKEHWMGLKKPGVIKVASKDPFEEKIQAMTDEELEEFRKEWNRKLENAEITVEALRQEYNRRLKKKYR